ncbi:hypothetical protein GKQ23_09020 [Erwinia sp. E602]|uniref:hypothetical protein n=1 Tax=Erwinia sp. E602 TaxID=2675378 RepID=UPI001BA6121B|nr:hypothetical protein [Erwinia sp. E602]QUG75122.1 hypothetical protein GKQ23_09020 [Erwinia sp. E602]
MTFQDLQFDVADTLTSIAESTHFWLSFDAEALETLTSPALDQLGDNAAGKAA